MYQKLFISISILFLLLPLSFCQEVQNQTPEIKNVIFLIPDGTSVGGITLARWYKGDKLALDEYACGLVRTYCYDSAITDSAPGATAYATGHKSHTGFIAVLPDVVPENIKMPGLAPINPDDAKKPVATLIEACKLKGKSVGIVSTSQVQHATPAAFTSHTPNRDDYETIGEQQVHNGLDVVLGAGWIYLVGDKRQDGEDMVKEIRDLGYDYVTTPEQMVASKASKLWGMFDPSALAYDFDRDPQKEPALCEMAKKAIEVLSQNPKGFFLMVEGSKVDWAAHANDPVGVVSDILAFEKAFQVAIDFAKTRKDTIVVACADHGNGGITMGERALKNYDTANLGLFLNPLKKAKLTAEGVIGKIIQDKPQVKQIIAEYYGIDDITDDEDEKIVSALEGRGNRDILGPMISKRAYIGWTTGGHTGEDVVLFMYSPAERLTGLVENIGITRFLEKNLGLELKAVSEQIFADAEAGFKDKGATVTVDGELFVSGVRPKKDGRLTIANPTLVVTKGETELRFPVNRNIVYRKGGKLTMKTGITIFNTKKWFVPKEALDLLP